MLVLNCDVANVLFVPPEAHLAVELKLPLQEEVLRLRSAAEFLAESGGSGDALSQGAAIHDGSRVKVAP